MNISFNLTTPQIRARTKTVTRRRGWRDLKPGTVLQAIEKGQGLKRGEKQVKLCKIRVVSVRIEPLVKLREMPYGKIEMDREGFPNHTPEQFITLYCIANKCDPTAETTRIEFEYVE